MLIKDIRGIRYNWQVSLHYYFKPIALLAAQDMPAWSPLLASSPKSEVLTLLRLGFPVLSLLFSDICRATENRHACQKIPGTNIRAPRGLVWQWGSPKLSLEPLCTVQRRQSCLCSSQQLSLINMKIHTFTKFFVVPLSFPPGKKVVGGWNFHIARTPCTHSSFTNRGTVLVMSWGLWCIVLNICQISF